MPSRRILVMKHGALGDIIQGLDAYASLRRGHGGEHLAVLTSPPFAGFFEAMPFFDEVLVDPRAGAAHLPALWRIRRLLRDNWGRIYDLQSSGRTARYCAYFVPPGVEVIAPHKGVSHPLPDMTALNNRDRMLAAARAGGCPEVIAPIDWLVAEKQQERPGREERPGQQKWGERPGQQERGEGADFAVLIPGSSPAKPQKRWPHGHYAALARRLDAAGIRPVLVGTELDKAAGEAIMEAMPACENLIGTTSLMELARLLASARLVVGNDTGPVFMAARLGVPTLMLMGCHTNAEMSAPHGPAAAWLQEDDIAAITPEAAFAHLKKMIPAL